MYDKRVKIFVIVSAFVLAICVLRLIQMQLLPDSSLQDDIAELKRQRGQSQQLTTVRGKILDRNGTVLATDKPEFQLHISYKLSSLADERVRRAKLLQANRQQNTNPSSVPADPMALHLREKLDAKLKDLQQILGKCINFGPKREDIEKRVKNINDRVWNLRTFVAWARNDPDPNILEKYGHNINSVPLSEAAADLQKKFPNEAQRFSLISKVDDIAEIGATYPLLQLTTDDDIFAAQVEFLDVNDIQILPKAKRFYPFGSVAAQTIGWVGPATQQRDKKIFANDRLSSYLDGEVCGRRPGVEYVCETILRGRRGEWIFDIDGRLVSLTETRFGKDVQISLDIELQQKIEDYLANYRHDPNCGPGMAAVVIDVATADILALVSMPVFDLNRARYDYEILAGDPNKPLINRAIYEQYPPGSAVKPLVLIAGLESGAITPDEVINCPAQSAPVGWPNCLIFNRNGIGHDASWKNIARNAVRGSCNIYFSQLADRIEPQVLQQWLFKFGYGRRICLAPSVPRDASNETHDTQYPVRQLMQAPGIISSPVGRRPSPQSGATDHEVEDLPPLKAIERRLFGIGQGNLRVTPLHAANAFAAIARRGIYRTPRLFLDYPSSSTEIRESSIDLNISQSTLDVVYEGMSAVVNESGGTAHTVFAHSGLAEQGVKVYGKTGSTEEPEVAWFGGFMTDAAGRSIAIAVVVEGGQRGSRDAAPLARDIIQLCIELGYIGQTLF